MQHLPIPHGDQLPQRPLELRLPLALRLQRRQAKPLQRQIQPAVGPVVAAAASLPSVLRPPSKIPRLREGIHHVLAPHPRDGRTRQRRRQRQIFQFEPHPFHGFRRDEQLPPAAATAGPAFLAVAAWGLTCVLEGRGGRSPVGGGAGRMTIRMTGRRRGRGTTEEETPPSLSLLISRQHGLW
ncbi:hypothetical protein ACHAXS_010030, partial [Conticribra weissflogii]